MQYIDEVKELPEPPIANATSAVPSAVNAIDSGSAAANAKDSEPVVANVLDLESTTMVIALGVHNGASIQGPAITDMRRLQIPPIVDSPRMRYLRSQLEKGLKYLP